MASLVGINQTKLNCQPLCWHIVLPLRNGFSPVPLLLSYWLTQGFHNSLGVREHILITTPYTLWLGHLVGIEVCVIIDKLLSYAMWTAKSLTFILEMLLMYKSTHALGYIMVLLYHSIVSIVSNTVPRLGVPNKKFFRCLVVLFTLFCRSQ